MSTTQLKSYAPEARKAFIAAVTAQAARLGISAKEISPAEVQGDVLLVNGKAFPKSAQGGRQKLIDRVKAHGFESTMDAVAYTWFNRLVAIRYMELHDYLDHGYRVLSNPDGSGRPEILDKAADVELPSLDRAKVVELKLDGTKDEELYRLLLKAQCNALHKAMPFLFEQIGDETELLLPPNLLHTDSLVRQLVESIDEDLWKDIEIIGWLYQFYISEKKDEVIGKVVKSEDIPAATQLFTPNWIVKYMVQNSLGAQWLATYPHSTLKEKMEYYIEPAEQTDEVKAQLAAITPESLNPEEITLIDPACGSGHILVEAYDLFKAIYVERGYREREAASLILTKNLFGLDIDQRAAQLAGFALMMKGRADDRRLFERNVGLNVMAMVDSEVLDIAQLSHGINLESFGLVEQEVRELKEIFEHATTFGSLIQLPESLAAKLPALRKLSETSSGDMFVAAALEQLRPLVQQAEILRHQYDNVVANPPYMGGNGMNGLVKKFAKDSYPDAKSDLFACFMERSYTMARKAGLAALVTIRNWMFLSSFQKLRERLLRDKTLHTLTQIGYNSFPSMNSKVAQAVVFSIRNLHIDSLKGSFVNLNSAAQSADKQKVFLDRGPSLCFEVVADNFNKIPGSPVAFWLSEAVSRAFENCQSLRAVCNPLKGMFTGDNERFVRYFWEVGSIYLGCTNRTDSSISTIRWYPYLKGGNFRKWYGNNLYVVNFYKDGKELRASGKYGERSPDYYFNECLTWSDITSLDTFAVRYCEPGFLTSSVGCGIFSDRVDLKYLSAVLCAKTAGVWLAIINPTLHANPGDLESIPLCHHAEAEAHAIASGTAERCIALAKEDWESYEHSWDFQCPPITALPRRRSLGAAYDDLVSKNTATIDEMTRLEEANNRLFIAAYGLQDELTPEVPIEQITLTVNPAYRYGIKATEEERQTRFREDTMQELVSYAIGCMMGRYSLDEPGLIYAHSGNEGFDPSRYKKFPADDDGIIPLTDAAWFEDDAANRLVEFISVAWDAAHLEENLTFLADNLSPKKNETSRDTIRRYLCDKFFKDHLQTYKKRPIYWLFSSGKQKAFQCLVYLHRYNEGTLARMRSEYVIPLQGKLVARLEHLKADIQATDSLAQQKRLEKEADNLKKQQTELLAFDEKLRHYADRRIKLDLDDGVKENYGKFGSLLAEVKTVHGKKPKGP